MTSPDCVSAGLGIDVIEADEVPNVRDLFEATMKNEGWPDWAFVRRLDGEYSENDTHSAWRNFRHGYRAAGGQGA